MPSNFFHKPENALKRAEELINVGKEADALDTLHDTIKAKRHKQQWSQTHELIMLKHLELCVLLKKQHIAKDALFQYKAITQQINVKSLETVIEFFLKLAEQKTLDAQKTSIEKVEEIDDLDQGDISETLLLAVVSGAAAQDRMDRTVLAPWLRFLWDSYRNCLELLRNNAQVEPLYHNIARLSFKFCQKYQRRTEFRKLCDLMRLHLNQIQKQQHLTHGVKLSSAESLAMMQETRLHQLDTAITMELWQEAYRSAEDVHSMMQLSKDKDKRMVKPASYVNYYDKLALVFWKAGNRLFHAAALLQKYTIYKDMKKSFTQEEAQEQASRVLLATLSIPDGADAPSDLTRHLDIEDQHIANIRMLSNLLRLSVAPTRAGILKECSRLNLPEVANEPTRNLYRLLENNFAPLRMASDMETLLTKVESEDHRQYIEALRMVVATKTLKQISVMYDAISWSRVRKIIPYYNDIELERLVVDVAKHRYVRAQIDHRGQCLRFGAADATLAGGVDLEDAGGFTGDDTQLGVEGIRSHLELMYNKLRAAVDILDGDKKREELIEKVKHHAKQYELNKQNEINRIVGRAKKIEHYKEIKEKERQEQTRAAQIEKEKREEANRIAELQRLEKESIEHEKKRKQAEHDDVQYKIKLERLRKMAQQAVYQGIIKEIGDDAFFKMDPDTLVKEQRERVDKERLETQKRLQQQEKQFDHHVRALHLEEMMERKALMMKRTKEAPQLHDAYENTKIAKAIVAHERQIKLWEMWAHVKEDALGFMNQTQDELKDNFEKVIYREWEEKLRAVRDQRLADRHAERKAERRAMYYKEKADEERRKRDEEERARQAQLDEFRKMERPPRQDHRGERRGGDRDRMEESRSTQDSNWRKGETTSSGPSSRSMGSGPFPPRDRQPMRERTENPPSAASQDTAWRAKTDSAPPPRPIANRPPTDRVERAAPPSNVPGGTWARGNVIKKESGKIRIPYTFSKKPEKKDCKCARHA
ncbi:hypothetical protein WR25_14519 isoform A [Diploscapter pachys]|uniref:Eukaryotic translation initiation factor 3 subunit A n=1 Tax=Diploscapter pachys TaxID=2018661 RepID=A0A2A2JUA5_9BILA|nr:hypothetical protein WR25_14519 isoform A [Diploscapter pachys]